MQSKPVNPGSIQKSTELLINFLNSTHLRTSSQSRQPSADTIDRQPLALSLQLEPPIQSREQGQPSSFLFLAAESSRSLVDTFGPLVLLFGAIFAISSQDIISGSNAVLKSRSSGYNGSGI